MAWKSRRYRLLRWSAITVFAASTLMAAASLARSIGARVYGGPWRETWVMVASLALTLVVGARSILVPMTWCGWSPGSSLRPHRQGS